MYKELVAFQKMYDLVLVWHPILSKFPKNARFTLGQEIENELLYILKFIMKINTMPGDRNKFFYELSEEFDVLFVYTKLAYDLKFLSAKQLGFLSEKMNEVIKICSGWLKASNTKSI